MQAVQSQQNKQIKQWIFNDLVPNYSTLPQDTRKHVKNIIDILTESKDKKVIQKYSRMGMLQKVPLLRSHIWKILLGTIILQPKNWIKVRQQNYKVYMTLVKKFFPSYLDQQNLLDIGNNDFKKQIWLQIQLDAKRTHTSMNFFQIQSQQIKLYATSKTRYSNILGRILYIWARTNSTVKYVQGMNQIIAPIFYLQFQRPCPTAQSQTFFMFSSLITFLIDMHIKEMDNYQHGIIGRIKTLNKYLKVVDIQLWIRLDDQGIDPQFYSFRWLSLLLSQQFKLQQTQKLWDTLLSFDGYQRFFFLFCVCLAILKLRKEFILKNQFVKVLPCLQKIKDLQIQKITGVAQLIYQKFSKVDMGTLFRQIQEKYLQSKGIKCYRAKTKSSSTQDLYANSVSNSIFSIFSKK